MWSEYWSKKYWTEAYWSGGEEEEAGAVVGTEGAPSQNVIYYDAIRTTSRPKALEDIDGKDLVDILEFLDMSGIITDRAA